MVRIFGRLCRFGEGDNFGTCSLPLEDQDWRINEHNIRKLGRNIGEIQGGFSVKLDTNSSTMFWLLKLNTTPLTPQSTPPNSLTWVLTEVSMQ